MFVTATENDTQIHLGTQGLLSREYDQVWSGPTGHDGKTKTSIKWDQRRGPFRKLVRGVSADKDHQLGGLFATTADPGGPKNNETILTRQCIELDLDHGTPDQVAAIKERIRDSGVACHTHTSVSHTSANPRLRFRFPLSRPIRADKYPGWADAVIDWLGVGTEPFDVKASRGMSQFMYLMHPDAEVWEQDTARCVLDVVTYVETPVKAPSEAERPPVGPATRATRLEAYGKLLDLRNRVEDDHPDGTDVYGLLSDGVKEEGIVNLIILFRFALAGDFGEDGREAVLSELASVVRPGYFDDPKSGKRLVDTSWAKAEEAGGQHPNGAEEFRYEGDGADLFVDLAALMQGTLPSAPPRHYGIRNDGEGLFYSKSVNMIFGDPESGKTWLALKAGSEALMTGGKFAFLDLDHNGAALTVGRLRDLGVPDDIIGDRDCFRYVDPEDKAELMAVVQALKEWEADVVLADSVGELLPLLGASSNSDDEYTMASRETLGVLANGGATVIAVDHMAKNPNSRSQGQTGAMAKKRATNGSSIRVEVEAQFTPGVGGRAKLKVNKDRNGKVREACPVGDREPWAGNLVMNISDDRMTLVVYAPTSGTEAEPPLVSFGRLRGDESFTALEAAHYLWTVVACEAKAFPTGDDGTKLKKRAERELEGLVRSDHLAEVERPAGSREARRWYLPKGR